MLCLFALSPVGFRHRDIRPQMAQLLGRDPETYPAGSMTYDLRRLRLHRLIARVPGTLPHHRPRGPDRDALAPGVVLIYLVSPSPTASRSPSTATRLRSLA